jgi:hypothetical protein
MTREELQDKIDSGEIVKRDDGLYHPAKGCDCPECRPGRALFEVERELFRQCDRVTMFLPMEDVRRCETVTEFRALLSNRVTPVLDEIVVKWQELQKQREAKREALKELPADLPKR